MGMDTTGLEPVTPTMSRLLSLGSSRDLQELAGISDPILIQFSISLAVNAPGIGSMFLAGFPVFALQSLAIVVPLRLQSAPAPKGD